MKQEVDLTGAVYREDGTDNGAGSATKKVSMSLRDRIQAVRQGGEVKRCHTFPIIGEYTNAQHQWGAVSLLLMLHPNPSLNLIKAVQFHDIGEHWYGDMPANAKWELPQAMGHMLEELEQKTVRQLIGPEHKGLDDEEQMWLIGLDKLELYIWAQDQVQNLGNRRAMIVAERLRNWSLKQDAQNSLPEPILELWDNWNSEPITELPKEG